MLASVDGFGNVLGAEALQGVAKNNIDIRIVEDASISIDPRYILLSETFTLSSCRFAFAERFEVLTIHVSHGDKLNVVIDGHLSLTAPPRPPQPTIANLTVSLAARSILPVDGGDHPRPATEASAVPVLMKPRRLLFTVSLEAAAGIGRVRRVLSFCINYFLCGQTSLKEDLNRSGHPVIAATDFAAFPRPSDPPENHMVTYPGIGSLKNTTPMFLVSG